MKIDPDIAEMLRYAIEHPFTESKNIKLYQRQLAHDLAITLYLSGEDGHVSLTAKRNIQKEDDARVFMTLASLSCSLKETIVIEGNFIRRYNFFNPLVKNPIFPSELDLYLPKRKTPKLQPQRVKPIYKKEPARRVVQKPTYSIILSHIPVEHSEQTILPPIVEKLYWDALPADRCHICHRELSDPLSIRVSIGSVCRKHIEKAEEKGPEMWEDISQQELERIWTTNNIYARRQREIGN